MILEVRSTENFSVREVGQEKYVLTKLAPLHMQCWKRKGSQSSGTGPLKTDPQGSFRARNEELLLLRKVCKGETAADNCGQKQTTVHTVGKGQFLS